MYGWIKLTLPDKLWQCGRGTYKAFKCCRAMLHSTGRAYWQHSAQPASHWMEPSQPAPRFGNSDSTQRLHWGPHNPQDGCIKESDGVSTSQTASNHKAA